MYFGTSRVTFKTLSALFDAPPGRPPANFGIFDSTSSRPQANDGFNDHFLSDVDFIDHFLSYGLHILVDIRFKITALQLQVK